MWFLRIIPLACLPLAGVLNDNNVIEIMVIILFTKIPFYDDDRDKNVNNNNNSDNKINPLLHNINVHILHTTPKTFPRVLTRRICSTIKRFFCW